MNCLPPVIQRPVRRGQKGALGEANQRISLRARKKQRDWRRTDLGTLQMRSKHIKIPIFRDEEMYWQWLSRGDFETVTRYYQGLQHRIWWSCLVFLIDTRYNVLTHGWTLVWTFDQSISSLRLQRLDRSSQWPSWCTTKLCDSWGHWTRWCGHGDLRGPQFASKCAKWGFLRLSSERWFSIKDLVLLFFYFYFKGSWAGKIGPIRQASKKTLEIGRSPETDQEHLPSTRDSRGLANDLTHDTAMHCLLKTAVLISHHWVI